MPEIFYPSSSAIELWQLCNARALGKYVAGVVEPETKALSEGKRLHKITQTWLSEGKRPSTHEPAFDKIVGALPVPGGSVAHTNIERVLTLPQWFGFMDWTDGYGRQGDLKFTGNPDYQRKRDPKTDTQRIVYARDEFYRDPFIAKLEQTWSVSAFNGSRALRLDHSWTRKAAKAAYEKNLAKAVDEMQEAVLEKRDWRDAAKNFGACDQYRPNGCPMKGHGCKPRLAQRLSSLRLKPAKVA
jgi:hypothetical protein